MDFAKRAFDHSHHIDPIVRSLMDTDFYKLLMLQFIYKKYFNTQVTFAVTNRTKTVRLAEEIDITELRAQLDHVRTLRFKASEIVWLRGQSFYGQQGIFKEDFLDFLRTFKLPEYDLREEEGPLGDWPDAHKDDRRTGQFVLEFHGRWCETSMWEIYALEIVNELRYRKIMSGMNRSELDIMYAKAKVKLYDKLVRLRDVEGLSVTDFGTRRRHSHLWQEHCILTACEVLGDKFTGTSNVYFAMKHDLEPRGTNAHELPMVLAALAGDDEELASAQYRVLQQWQNVYSVDALKVMLPDTFGTTQFLKGAPEWARLWTGARPDSKKPIPGGEELIEYWKRTDPINAEQKLIIFSDGMDVHIPGHEPHGEDIVAVHNHFHGRVRVGFGFGTMLTNDFVDCHPGNPEAMKAISLVCKVKTVDQTRPAVKLSDNPTKATGLKSEVERYLRVFGTEGSSGAEVLV
jgi:nicotinate phosphoribosyltransferase